jgi:glycosyltransferase involved in cell wall biosynthesis
MVRNVDEIIVVSRDLKNYFQGEYKRRTAYIPNGVERPPVDVPEFGSIIRDLGLSAGGYIVYLGRLVPEKRIEDILTAFGGIQTDQKLVIAGDDSGTGEYVAKLHRLARVDSRVVFVGLQGRKAVHSLLCHASMYVSASELEGLPMTLLECMQRGKPAVVSDIPPHRELLGTAGEYDLFFPPSDISALRLRIMQVLRDPQSYFGTAQRATELIAREYSWPSIADKTEILFRNVAARIGSRRAIESDRDGTTSGPVDLTRPSHE